MDREVVGKVEENKRKESRFSSGMTTAANDGRRISRMRRDTPREADRQLTGRPTYPLNSKSHPPRGCYLRHHRRNSLPLRENPRRRRRRRHRPHDGFSLSPCPSSRRPHPDLILLISHSLAGLSLYSKYRLTPRPALCRRRRCGVKPDRHSHTGCLA